MTHAGVSKLVAATALACMLVVPDPASAQFNYEVLHTFPTLPAFPNTRLVQAKDGTFYGTTNGTTQLASGTIFALRPRSEGGFSLTILHEFDITEGGSTARLIQAQDGDLYGATYGGLGTIFRISPAGVFTTVHAFTGADGIEPSGLVQATDGSFYGTTSRGGAANLGTVFRMTADGTLTTAHSCTGGSDCTRPNGGPLIQAADGAFYGATAAGFTSQDPRATIFRMTPDGTLTTLHTFGEFEGPAGELVQGTDGDFYGTVALFTGEEGAKAFKLTPSGIFTHLHTFTHDEGVGVWSDALIQMNDGNFYGTMRAGGTGTDGAVPRGTVFKMTPAGDVTVLHTFTGNDGAHPSAGLILARDGLLYGVLNGSSSPYDRDLGRVFSTDTVGAITPVYAFQDHEAGCNPWGGLIQASDGALYGTTRYGGTANRGTVYRMTGNGMVTTLHSFTGPDGFSPLASLLQASDGNFYGTTNEGGNSDQGPFNSGTVFRMTPEGAVTTLHSFHRHPLEGGEDGTFPWAPLIQASDGNLYGTTLSGGPGNGGTLFRMSLSGNYQNYYAFYYGYPVAPLIQARDGFLYGTLYGSRQAIGGSVFRVTPDDIVTLNSGGTKNYITAGLTEASDGTFYSTSFGANALSQPQAGSVFKMTPEGVKTVLHTFRNSEGFRPFNAPIEASDGNFYGTTHRYGNETFWGSIYRVTPTGSFTTLKTVMYAEGAHPSGKLLQASDGKIYGVSYMGGRGDCGVIYRFTIPSSAGKQPMPAISSQH